MDIQQFRRQYSAMTDEALLEVDPSELIDGARIALEDELRARKLHVGLQRSAEPVPELDGAGLDGENQPPPHWLSESIVVFSESYNVRRDSANDSRLEAALAVLVGAGIDSHTIVDNDPQNNVPGSMTMHVHVPAHRQLEATSVLDKQIFNAQIEQDWRALFDSMNDDELLALDEDALVGGLRDRADRLIRAWEDELLKRGLAELESGSTAP